MKAFGFEISRTKEAVAESAVEKAAAPKAKTAPMGFIGLKTASGKVEEEFLKQLQWPDAGKVYQEMASNDAVIGGCLYLIETLIRKANWGVEAASEDPGDVEAAEFVKSCMFDMSDQSWDDFICEVLTMLPYGFSFHEIVYKTRRGPFERDPKFKSNYSDGRIGWQELPGRSQATLSEWTFDASTGKAIEFVQDPSLTGGTGNIVKIPIEGNLLFKTKTARGNPEGWSILRRAYRCFSEDTELLTKAGWTKITEITTVTELATLNKETGYLEYQQPSAMNVYDYDGQMVRVQTKYLDQLITPNHRAFVKKSGAAGYTFVEASQLKEQQRMLRGVKWKGEDTRQHIVPTYGVHQATEKVIDMITWASFMGILISDGFTCVTSGGQHFLGVTQQEGSKADAIRELFAKLPYHVYEHSMPNNMISFEIYDKALCLDVRPYCGTSLTKHIPQEIKQASADVIAAYVAWHWFGDGGISGATTEYAGTLTISTVSKTLADDLQELALKLEKAAVISIREQAASYGRNPLYFVSFSEVLECKVHETVLQDYAGKVYCPTTENGVVMARRNGKMAWSGNSWFFKRYIEELEGIGIERNLAGIPVLQPPEDVPLFDPNNEEMKDMLAWAQQLVNELRQDKNHGLVLPGAWTLKLMGTEGSSKTMDTDTIIRRHENRIAMSMLSDVVMMGGDRTGSFALAETKQGLLMSSLQAIINSIASTLNTHAIPALFAVNSWQLEKLPKIKAGDLQPVTIKEVALLLRTFKVDVTKDQKMFNFLMGLIQAPTMTDDEFAAFMAQQTAAQDDGNGEDPDSIDNDLKQQGENYTGMEGE